ncbi:MAG: hypothetical protein Q8932_17145, partial [Bacteroidota bacterium]|nr:hypothetical protein [Bacteroidota bacterium]
MGIFLLLFLNNKEKTELRYGKESGKDFAYWPRVNWIDWLSRLINIKRFMVHSLTVFSNFGELIH